MKQLLLIIAMLVSIEIIAKEQDIPVTPDMESPLPKKRTIPKAPVVTISDNILSISGVVSSEPIMTEIKTDGQTVYEDSSTQYTFILPELDENVVYTLNLYIGSICWTGTFLYEP